MAPKIGSLLTLKESPSVFLQVPKETKPQRPPLTELTRYLKVLVNQMFLHQTMFHEMQTSHKEPILCGGYCQSSKQTACRVEMEPTLTGKWGFGMYGGELGADFLEHRPPV